MRVREKARKNRTCMELNLGLPLVHFHRVMCHEQVFRVVAERQPNHILLFCVLRRNLALGVFQCQRRGSGMVLDVR